MTRHIARALTFLFVIATSAVAQDTSAAPVKRASATGEIRLTYLGNAGWEITDGLTTVLVDPFLSQFARWDPSRPQPDRATNPIAAPVPIGDKTIVPYALTVGDVNCDGSTDFIVGNVTAPSVVYFSDGTGKTFNPISFGDSKGTAYGIAVGDFDKDGRPDIAVARSEAPNVLYFASGPVGKCK